MESGFVIHEGNTYTLRVENLKSLIEEIEKDIKRACDDLKEVAKEIDEKLGIQPKNRKMEHNNIMRFFGVLKNLDWDEKEKDMEHLRSSFNKRLEIKS